MKKLVFCLIALTPAFALAAPGPYATIQAGLNTVDSDNSYQTDTWGFVGGAAVGYLWGNSAINYGLEADGLVYPNSNSSKSNAPTYSAGDFQSTYDGYNLSLLAVLKFTSCSTGLTGFIKAGGAYVNQQLTTDYQGSSFTSKETDTIAPEAAIGGGYMFTPNLEVDITWDHIFGDSQDNGDFSANPNRQVVDKDVTNDNILLGLTYHFA